MKNFWINRHKKREQKKAEEAINKVVQHVLRKKVLSKLGAIKWPTKKP